jgi:hypothetical protein
LGTARGHCFQRYCRTRRRLHSYHGGVMPACIDISD